MLARAAARVLLMIMIAIALHGVSGPHAHADMFWVVYRAREAARNAVVTVARNYRISMRHAAIFSLHFESKLRVYMGAFTAAFAGVCDLESANGA